MCFTPTVRSLTCTVCLLLSLTFFTNVSISGFYFLTNQYVYFRFSEDAGLPYIPKDSSSGCKNLSNTLRRANDSPTLREQVQARTAKFLAMLSLISIGLSLLALVFVAHLSDRYGRRFTIGFILLGQSVTHGVTALVVLLHLPVPVIIVGSIVCGFLGGGQIALITQTSVCFADLTRIPPETQTVLKPSSSAGSHTRSHLERNRLIFLGMFDATLLLTSALGYGLMGSVIQRCGFSVSVIGLLAIYSIPVVLLFFLPETKPPTISLPPIQLFSPNSLTNPDSPPVMESVRITYSSGLAGFLHVFRAKHPTTLLVAIVMFLFTLVILSDNQFSFLYLMGAPFCWTPEGVGIYNFVGNSVISLASLTLTLVTAWSMRPTTIMTKSSLTDSRRPSTSNVALLLDDEIVEQPIQSDATHLQPWYYILRSRIRMLTYITVAFGVIITNKLIMGFAFKLSQPFCNAAVYVALVLLFVRAALIPTLKSFISSLHAAEDQSRLFSILGVAEYLGLLSGEPGLSALYALTVSVFPGAVYLFCAALSAIALILVLVLLISVVKELMSLKNCTAIPSAVQHTNTN